MEKIHSVEYADNWLTIQLLRWKLAFSYTGASREEIILTAILTVDMSEPAMKDEEEVEDKPNFWF
jgi:hypothetical protein